MSVYIRSFCIEICWFATVCLIVYFWESVLIGILIPLLNMFYLHERDEITDFKFTVKAISLFFVKEAGYV